MQNIEIDKRLVPELEECIKELGVEKIYAGSSMELMNSEHFLYPVFVFRNGTKQKIVFDGNFIKDNDFETVFTKIKHTIKENL